MELINRSDQILTYWTYNWKDFFKGQSSWSISHEWIHPGQRHDAGQGVDEVAIYVQPGTKSGGLDHRALVVDGAGPYRNTTSLVLLSDQVVDWGEVRRSYTSSGSALVPTEHSDEVLQTMTTMGGIAVTALATGLAALGPAGALPAGLTLGIGSLVLMVLEPTSADPPPPPNLDEVSEAVRHVVRAELDMARAEDAATSFLVASDWLLRTGRTFHAQLLGHGADGRTAEVSDHDARDFRSGLEGYALGDGYAFQQNLAHMKSHPEQGMYIIPALLVGIGAQLRIQWLHHLVRHLDGARITDETVKDFQDEVRSCAQALSGATRAWEAHCDAEETKHSLAGTDEGAWIRSYLTRSVTGHDDLTFATAAAATLDSVAKVLTEDISALANNRTPSHFWHEKWKPSA